MRQPIKLFVSAGPDLEAERDVIGRVVADLPLATGWVIGRTPGKGQRPPADLAVERPAPAATASDCDLFLFIMGQDISAPAGAEWDAAQASRRPTLALLKDANRTPAGREFLRFVQTDWIRFATLEELEREARTGLVRNLLTTPERFGLTLPEIEHLAVLAAEDEAKADQGAGHERLQDGGAGGGGVIMPSPPGSG